MTRPPGAQLVGIEIGDSGIRLAAAMPEGAHHVVHCHHCPLPAGAVDAGYVRDTDVVVEALRSLLSGASLRPRRVSLVLGGRRTVCRVEPLVGGSDPAAQTACAERMRRYVAFGGQATAVGHTLQEAPSQDDASAWLFSAATLRDLVARQVEVARRCGLDVVHASPTMAVVVRILLAAHTALRPSFVLVAHDSGCGIGAVCHNGLVFCQHLPCGVQALAQDPDLLIASLEPVADYYFRHAHGSEPIETIVCCGAAAPLEACFDRLAECGVNAEWIDPAGFAGVERLEGDAVATAAERAAMAPVAAAALAGVDEATHAGSIDLLPPPDKKRRFALLSPAVLAPTILALLLVGGLMTWDWLARREAKRLTYIVNHPTPAMLECSRLLARESQIRQQCRHATELLQAVPRRTTEAFVAELPRRLPKALWLDRIDIGADGACIIEGMTHAEDPVFAFADSLRRSPYVDTVQMGGTGNERDGGVILTRFRLDLVLAESHDPSQEGEQK